MNKIIWRKGLVIMGIVITIVTLLMGGNLYLGTQEHFGEPQICSGCAILGGSSLMCNMPYVGEGSFKLELNLLGVSSEEIGPVYLEEISLTQLLPLAKVNCSLNLTTVSPEMRYEDKQGLLLKGGKSVNITLECTEFSRQEVKQSVWKINARISDSILTPQGTFKIPPTQNTTGIVWINYNFYSENETGWRPYTFFERLLKKCV